MNWHRALDVQMDTLKWIRDGQGSGFIYNFFSSLYHSNPDEFHGEVFDLVHRVQATLWRADTIFITTDMMHLLLQAAHDLPEDIVWDSHILISKMGFVLFEEPIDGVDRSNRQVTMHGLAWENIRLAATEEYPDGRDVIMIYYFTDPTDFNDEFNAKFLDQLEGPPPPLMIAHFYPVTVGTPLPKVTIMGSEIVVGILKLFVAMQMLAQQRIGAPMRLRPDRASRKRYAREHPDGPERIITLITLRRKSVKKDDEEPMKVEWSRRWVVRGFWRRQWYPSLKRHDWKYIYEHVKGPEDKPLIVTERHVFNFRR
jgi:hypothetical protein